MRIFPRSTRLFLLLIVVSHAAVAADPTSFLSSNVQTPLGGKPTAEVSMECGASPLELRCQSADGKTLILRTQLNRDAASPDYNGFTTRHDCYLNKTVVNAVDIGAQAQVGSIYVQGDAQKGATFQVMDPEANKLIQPVLYWVIQVPPDMQSKAKANYVRLYREAGDLSKNQAIAYIGRVAVDGKITNTKLNLKCE